MSRFSSRRLALATLLAVAALPLAARAQQGTDREFRWSKSLPAGSWVRLHNITGDVTVTATDGDRVEVVALRRGSSGDTETRVEVDEHASGVTVCVLHTADAYCDERGARSEGHRRRSRRSSDNHAYYNFEVRVPRRLRVAANSVTGDVRVTGTTGELRAASVSGDVRVERVRATTRLDAVSVSGDVTAQLDQLADGTDLSVTSVSGDITVTMPQDAGVALTMSTLSGALESDFPLNIRGRMSKQKINATIGSGRSDMRVSTVSGDVRLRATRN